MLAASRDAKLLDKLPEAARFMETDEIERVTDLEPRDITRNPDDAVEETFDELSNVQAEFLYMAPDEAVEQITAMSDNQKSPEMKYRDEDGERHETPPKIHRILPDVDAV